VAKQKQPIIRENAVIYARYSSSGQREESIEGQLRECKDFAMRMNLNVIGEYCDYALTGTLDKRPEFQRMIRDAARGQFTTVLVWKLDRFARNKYDSAIYKTQLKKNGVRVISAKEVIPEGPEGILLESMMEGYAEYYSANLSQNVKRGLYESALKLQTLGQTLYGLRKAPDGRYEQDPQTAPVVRRIFDEYISGRPAIDIYKDLNRDGFRTQTGGLFNKSSLRRILQNQKYCGVYEYADIRVEDGIPAIVSKETFRKAKAMVQQHHCKPAAKKIEGGFLLTGKLFCGHCGEMMTSDGGTSKTGRVYSYYTCNNRRVKKCDKERAPKQWIEDQVVDALIRIANDDEVIDAFADHYMAWQADKETHAEMKILEDRLRKNETAIKNVMTVIDSGLITDSVRSHLLDLEAEKADIQKGIAIQKIEEPSLKRSEVVYFLKSFRDGDKNDIAWRIFIVETFLQAAYLFDDGRLIITLNYGGKNNKITVKIAEKAVRKGEPLSSNFAPPSPPDGANLNTIEVFFFEGIFAVQICATRKHV
jgi:DNA invertase Pin-like site-specific DNA recombinase